MKEEAIDNFEKFMNNTPEEEGKIGKYKRVEAGSKKSFGNFEAELVNKVSSYCTLIDMDRTKYISSLIEKDLENKVIHNDFMELEEYFYFNWQELLNKKTVKATNIEPLHDLEEYYIVKKISNNLDKFSVEYNSFCYGNNPYIHRGFYFLPKVKKADNGLILETYILVFDYDVRNDFLEISLIDNKQDLLLYRMDTTAEGFFSNMRDYMKEIITEDNKIDLITFFSPISILENYSNRKMLEAAKKYGKLERWIKDFEEEEFIPEDVYPYIALIDDNDPHLKELNNHLNGLEEINIDVEIYGMESEGKISIYLDR